MRVPRHDRRRRRSTADRARKEDEVTSTPSVPHKSADKTKTPAASRPIADLVEALQRHVKLLRQYAEQAFDKRDDDYLGEVAAKLRLLVITKRPPHVPLLVELMNTCQIPASLTVKYDSAYSPPPAHMAAQGGSKETITVAEMLDLPALAVETSTGKTMLTKRDLIEVVAQKYGAAHEDWEHPEYLTLIRESDLRIKGYAPLAAALRPIVTVVLTVADHVLPRLTSDVIAAAEHRRQKEGARV
jgi:hypothetical protein